MRIHLIAVGDRMPDWVRTGYQTYARRLPRSCQLQLHEITPGTRGKADPTRAVTVEAERIEAAIPRGAYRVALDLRGQLLTTAELAERLEGWRQGGRDVALIVGGADGLEQGCMERCELRWSLGPLTFPHALVRPIVAEQLYRAWSILTRHPYHRA